MNKIQNIVGIHQPNFFPWLGYFNKIVKSDTFVFLDDVKYVKRSYCNRVHIKDNKGDASWLTLAVSNLKDGQTFNQVKIDPEGIKNIPNLLYPYYKNAPFYKENIDWVLELIYNKHEFISEYNIHVIKSIVEKLGIDTKFVRMSELTSEFGAKNELMLGICLELKASAYLSGDGAGKDYNIDQTYINNNIDLLYTNFKHPHYPQINGNFLSHTSILDIIFNCGLAYTKQILL